MNIRSRLVKSLDLLVNDVLVSKEPSIVVDRLNDWYQFCLSGIRQNARGDSKSVDWFLATPLDELPITNESIESAKNLASRYKSGELTWSVDAAFGMISELVIHRDWSDCCPFDQGDLEYYADENGRVAKLCGICGTATSVRGAEFEEAHSRPATKSELRAVRLFPDNI